MSDGPAGVCWHPPEINPEYPLGAYTDAEGGLVVWVNASPEHKQHAGGWFEPYDGAPGDYAPKRDADAGDDGYCLDPDAEYAEQARLNRENRDRVNGELDELGVAARESLTGDALKTRLAEIEKARP